MRTDYATQRRDPEVLAAVEECNKLLRSSGVAAVCADCWAGRLKDDPDWARLHIGEPGCCGGCELSASTGCLNKPISCAVWLCKYATRRFPAVAKKLHQIEQRFPSLLSGPYAAFRTRSLDFELDRLLRKEAIR